MPTNVQQRTTRSMPTVSSSGLAVAAVLLASVIVIVLLASFFDLAAITPPQSESMLWAP